MRHISKALAGAGLLALAACGGRDDDRMAENVEEAYENQAEALEAQADNATTEAQEDALDDQAEAVQETGEEMADAIDDADVVVNQQ